MSPLDLLPWWAKVLIVAALLAACAWAVHAYNEHEREIGRAEIRAEDAAKDLAQREADAKETQRRLERQGDAQREDAKELARYQRAAADARAARDQYHQLLDDLEAVARIGSSDSATADQRQAGTAAAGMLADVSRSADDMAERYARIADESRRAGVLCERSYDALNKSP